MPSFHDTATSTAPPEQVWKLLYDPSRFPDWWEGIGTVEVASEADPRFLRRLSGHMETGRPSWSDPAIGRG